MQPLCGHGEPCDIDARFARIAYCIEVTGPVFDLFFNARHGYRGSYFDSPHRGLEVNHAIIERLRPVLLTDVQPDGVQVDASTSLQCLSAKVWLAELGKQRCPRCAGEWNAPSDGVVEIRNGRWEVDTHPYARYGVRAPYLTKIRIFGGFIDDRGNELIPADKKERNRHIWARGWS
jgi:hypothetical protein